MNELNFLDINNEDELIEFLEKAVLFTKEHDSLSFRVLGQIGDILSATPQIENACTNKTKLLKIYNLCDEFFKLIESKKEISNSFQIVLNQYEPLLKTLSEKHLLESNVQHKENQDKKSIKL